MKEVIFSAEPSAEVVVVFDTQNGNPVVQTWPKNLIELETEPNQESSMAAGSP